MGEVNKLSLESVAQSSGSRVLLMRTQSKMFAHSHQKYFSGLRDSVIHPSVNARSGILKTALDRADGGFLFSSQHLDFVDFA